MIRKPDQLYDLNTCCLLAAASGGLQAGAGE